MSEQNRLLQWLARSKINRIDVKLAGLRAALDTTKRMVAGIDAGNVIPPSLVSDLRNIPPLIAELEEKRRQIALRLEQRKEKE